LYQDRIKSTYFEPAERGESVKRNIPINFPDLATFVYNENLPLPIIDTSALIDDDSNHYGALMVNSVYEFTPYRYGSGAYKHFQYSGDKPVDFATAVAISGAAMDTPNLVIGGSQQMFYSALNLDLGYHIRNRVAEEDNPSTTSRVLQELAPFPIYYSTGWARDLNGHSIYLTDGGYADNLAAYSVVRRVCKNIIIVDAEYEHDWPYKFDSYFKLKNAIRSEMGAKLSVDGIGETPSDTLFNAKEPIMKGTVKSFPLRGRGNVTLNIAYIKLSASDTDQFEYGRKARDEWDQGENRCAPSHSHSCFPQIATTDQSLTRSEYIGYVELGRAIVNLHRNELLNDIGMKPEEVQEVQSCFDTRANKPGPCK
jgi:hypothetical protein